MKNCTGRADKLSLRNVSRGGVQLKLEGEHDLVPGDTIDVVIKLEAEKTVTVRKAATVKNVGNKTLSSEFLEVESRGGLLGAFLLKNGLARGVTEGGHLF